MRMWSDDAVKKPRKQEEILILLAADLAEFRLCKQFGFGMKSMKNSIALKNAKS